MADWKRVERLKEHDEASGNMEGLAESTYGIGAIQFIPVAENTTFRGEYGVKDDAHLVFHFFGTEEANRLPDPWRYWKNEVFPAVLQKVAVEHFRTGPPYLRAAFSDDLCSWWLQCDGAAKRVLDVDAYARKFLDKLDAALDAAVQEAFGCMIS